MLRVVYRLCAAENAKPRPQFYSKAACLRSLLRALAFAPPTALTVVCDGAPPEDCRALAGDWPLLQLPGRGNSASMAAAIDVAIRWPADDLVYFVEDDYLHVSDALCKLDRVFAQLRPDYATLYDHPDRYRPLADPDYAIPKAIDTHVDDHSWRSVESTCMSFAARVHTVRTDRETFAAYLSDDRHPSDRELFRELGGLGPHRRGRRRPRTLLGPVPSLATHCELGHLAPGVDWERIATLG